MREERFIIAIYGSIMLSLYILDLPCALFKGLIKQ